MINVEGTYRTPGQTWETPVGISTASEDLSEPSLAMDARGDALTSWGVGLYEPDGKLLLRLCRGSAREQAQLGRKRADKCDRLPIRHIRRSWRH
jgi:hypothetical protein